MKTALVGFYLFQAVVGIVLYSNQYGSRAYQLHFARVRYTFTQAFRTCREKFGQLSLDDIPNEFLNNVESLTQISGDVWITDNQSSCMTVKRECKMMSSSAFGGGRCQDMEWVSARADCSTSRRYIICLKDVSATTTTTSTTTSTTTTTTTSTTTTTTPTTRRTTFLKTDDSYNDLEPDAVSKESSLPIQILSSFFVGFQLGSKDLLGLIIGVTIGTFLIFLLVFVLCCACQGSTPKYPEKYELVMSEGTLSGGRQSDMSYTTQDCIERGEATTESSLEMASCNQESSTLSDSVTPNNGEESLYNTLTTINKHKNARNPLYEEETAGFLSSSSSTSGRPRPSLASIELPPPPTPSPPPPPSNQYNEVIQPFMHSIQPDCRTYSAYNQPDDSLNSTTPRFNQLEETIDEVSESSDQDETCIKLVHPSMKKVLMNTVHVRPIIHHTTHYSSSEDDLPKDSKSALVSTFF